MSPEDHAFTVAWWERLLKDEEKLVRWLQKLHGTELSGYQDNRDAADKWAKGSLSVTNVLYATGDDEMRHSELLVDVLRGRGAWPIEAVIEESAYWNEMDAVIDSLESCAAVFHLGERLAAERFEVLANHPDTPKDIMGFLTPALPDEQHHARIFFKMTTPETFEKVLIAHNEAVQRLKSK
jgi:hypothetical protein